MECIASVLQVFFCFREAILEYGYVYSSIHKAESNLEKRRCYTRVCKLYTRVWTRQRPKLSWRVFILEYVSDILEYDYRGLSKVHFKSRLVYFTLYSSMLVKYAILEYRFSILEYGCVVINIKTVHVLLYSHLYSSIPRRSLSFSL